MQITYKVELLEGCSGYMAYCPSMKPVRVFGKTREEAMKKIPEAIKLYLERHPQLKSQLESVETFNVS